MKKWLTLLSILFCSVGFSQDSLLNYFIVSETPQNTLLLRWEIKSGNTCNGIEILHSTNDTLFEVLETIEGICGSSVVSTPFQWKHLSPVSNRINYYKLRLGSGFAGESISVFFVETNNDGYFLYPNPADDQIKIYFKNDDLFESRINLINQSGQIVQTTWVNSGNWEPDITNLPTGIYIFSIEVEQRIILGRFIKK